MKPEQIQALVLAALCDAEDAGHTFTPAPLVLDTLQRGGSIDKNLFRQAVYELVEDGRLLRDQGAELYRPAIFQAEIDVAEHILHLQKFARPLPLPRFSSDLAKRQEEAAQAVFRHGVTVILGPPGSGKTTVVRAILGAWRGGNVLLLAPTGKAARRLGESAGAEGSTIQRALQVQKDGSFQHNERNPLPARLVVIDEASMLDIEVAAALLRAVRPGARLVLIGDPDQLPSVGPGQVLADLVASAVAHVSRLKRIHRQAADSAISRNAAALRGGNVLDLAPAPGWRHVDRREEGAIGAAVEEAVRMTREGLECQVLAPTRNAVFDLNQHLQELLNPKASDQEREIVTSSGERFRAGDKIVICRNDYREGRDVRNGQAGSVAAVLDDGLLVEVDGRLAEFAAHEIEPDEDGRPALMLGYAMTVHKSQGSEYGHVILCIPHRSRALCKELVYTAITRGRQSVTLIGPQQVIETASGTSRRRYSKLLTRLRNETRRAREPA